MRYSLCLSYDGSAFCLLGRKVPVTGAGRTDTGVHAVGYIAHFDYDGMLPFEASDFTYKLNAMLPREVVVHSVSVVPDDFHARFSARRREYTYFIHRQKDPFLRSTSWLCGYPSLDFDAMNAACQFLLGTHDFSCFEKTGGDNKTSICTVFDAFWAPSQTHGHPRPCKREGPTAASSDALRVGRGRSEAEAVCDTIPFSVGNYWYFRIAADRFLRNMVRATVGTLIEVGRGKHSPEWVAELIASGTRGDAGESVPGHALFLNKVLY